MNLFVKKEAKGYITVYLSLMAGILISLIGTVLLGIRTHTMRFETESVMDLGLNSIFAEYHRGMYERYRLLFIDSSYGGAESSIDYTKSHLLHYMNMNFEKNVAGITNTSLTGLHADNCNLTGVSYATDNNGEVLRYQIEQLMKSRMFVNSFDDLNSNEVDMDKLLNDYDACCNSRNSADERVTTIVDEINSSLPEDTEPYSVSNPAASVETLGANSVLYYAIGDAASIPMSAVDLSDYVSKRQIVQGSGLRETQKTSWGADKVMFLSYLFDVCGYYKNERQNSRLHFQLEYLIADCASDIENLEKIATYIFMTRYPVNMSYLLSNEGKIAEAEAMALLASSIVGSPELTEAIKFSILFAWGYAESAKDVRIIFDGNSIGLMKTDTSWNTPLSQLVDFKAHLSEYHNEPGVMDYRKYLYGFLMATSIDRLSLGLMDVMEMDIRLLPGNSDFKMNNQIYQLTADVNVSSRFNGEGFSIKRFYSYE